MWASAASPGWIPGPVPPARRHPHRSETGTPLSQTGIGALVPEGSVGGSPPVALIMVSLLTAPILAFWGPEVLGLSAPRSLTELGSRSRPDPRGWASWAPLSCHPVWLVSHPAGSPKAEVGTQRCLSVAASSYMVPEAICAV